MGSGGQDKKDSEIGSAPKKLDEIVDGAQAAKRASITGKIRSGLEWVVSQYHFIGGGLAGILTYLGMNAISEEVVISEIVAPSLAALAAYKYLSVRKVKHLFQNYYSFFKKKRAKKKPDELRFLPNPKIVALFPAAYMAYDLGPIFLDFIDTAQTVFFHLDLKDALRITFVEAPRVFIYGFVFPPLLAGITYYASYKMTQFLYTFADKEANTLKGLKALWYKVTKGREKELRYIESALKDNPNWKQYINLGSWYIKEHCYDAALDCFSKAFTFADKERPYYESVLDSLWADPLFDEGRFRKLLKRGDTDSLIELAFLHFKYRNFDQTQSLLEEATDKIVKSGSPLEKEVRILYALSLKRIGLEDSAREQLGMTIKRILEESRGREKEVFDLVGESNNVVFRCKPKSKENPQGSTLSSSIFVFKSGNEAGLEDAVDNYDFFKTRLEDDDIYELIGRTEHDGRTYLIPRYAGETLFDIAQKARIKAEELYKLFEQSIDLVHRIHRIGEEGYKSGRLRLDDVVEQDPNYFTNRIRNVFFGQAEGTIISVDEKTKAAFLEKYAVINNRLVKARRTFYIDANPKNIIKIAGKLGVKIIDLENKKLLPPQIDLIKLLEFLEDLSQQQIVDLIDRYVKLDGEEIDRDDFFMPYPFVGAQTHLDIIGYCGRDFKRTSKRTRKEEYLEDASRHLEQAKRHLEGIYEADYLAGKEKGEVGELRALSDKIVIQAH